MYETNWKQLDKIDIVYSINDTVTFNGVKYPKAYIVENGNKKSLDTAIKWANGWYGNTTVNNKAKIVTTDNSNFEMQIVDAPGNSSQSGKLAFWMCLFAKDGVPTFATGINSELLNIIILQGTFKNGALLEEKTFFARSNGQLGVLHKNMTEYKNFCKDVKTRENVMNGSKTKNWQTGYSYVTTREKDVMFGTIKHPFYCIDYTNNYALDFNVKPSVFYGYTPSNAPFDFDDAVRYALFNVHKTSCPARVIGEKMFDVDDTYPDRLYSAIEKQFHKELSGSRKRYFDALMEAIIIYEHDSKLGLKLLKEIEFHVNKAIAGGIPIRNYQHECYLTYNGTKTTYPDEETFFLAVIKLVRDHHNAKGVD